MGSEEGRRASLALPSPAARWTLAGLHESSCSRAPGGPAWKRSGARPTRPCREPG